VGGSGETSSSAVSLCNSNENSNSVTENGGGGAAPVNGVLSSANGESSCDSRDVSRASSAEREPEVVFQPPPATGRDSAAAWATAHTVTGVADGEEADGQNGARAGNKRKAPRRAGSLLTKKRLTASIKVTLDPIDSNKDFLLQKLEEDDDDLSAAKRPVTLIAPAIASPPSTTTPAAGIPAAPTSPTSPVDSQPQPATTTSAPVNNAANEDNGEPKKKKKGRPRKLAMSVVREHNERIAGGILGLDALHQQTLKGIKGEECLNCQAVGINYARHIQIQKAIPPRPPAA